MTMTIPAQTHPLAAPLAPTGRGLKLPLSLVVGPLLLGFCLGLPYGILPALQSAYLLPAIIVGVGAFMLPALYIGTAFLGQAPSARGLLHIALAALQDMSIVLAGIAPATLFLLVTLHGARLDLLLAPLPVILAALLALRALLHRLRETGTSGATFLVTFGIWSAVTLGIGSHLFIHLLTTLSEA